MAPVVAVWCAGFVALLALKVVVGQWAHARASGWPRLGRRYPADGPCGPTTVGKPTTFDRAVVRVHSHWYHLSPVVGVDGAGIRLSMRPAWRPFHPPVFIPWDDVTAGTLDADGSLPLGIGESGRLTLTGPAARATAMLLARRARGSGQRSA